MLPGILYASRKIKESFWLLSVETTLLVATRTLKALGGVCKSRGEFRVNVEHFPGLCLAPVLSAALTLAAARVAAPLVAAASGRRRS